jgi:hypothetical protein
LRSPVRADFLSSSPIHFWKFIAQLDDRLFHFIQVAGKSSSSGRRPIVNSRPMAALGS